ncbi:MAG: DegT/DnrJ/EryC1/StrS family aminotransferase [bacterium]|nr:DegT/DnrJ/EryC1/StrS family aminotransferase [bacterium]MCX7917535.1 DegT/DnrJ/EryC1/StrS family aminotransferase [bacterium]MDW8164098.1 DegT/DnrJ/EryC1/StrS family aminotransferase [Candidatus Omnitrophota bacterium]
MDKRKIPFGTISITEKAKNLVYEILETKRVSQGKYVKEFEEKFAEICGTKYAVAVSSGTDAIALALSVMYDYGAQRQDEIILPALTFIGTANAVLMAGFSPVFIDVEFETLNINPEKIEEKITKKTKAILPVHLMGKPANMYKICEIAKKYKLFLIEDAAEAHGAKYDGKNIGTFGDMGCFSTYVAHIISTIEGGIIITDNCEYAEILRSLRSHGRACKCDVCVLNTSSGYCQKRFKYGRDIRFVFERVGFSSKMNEIEAVIGLGNLEIYKEILEQRRKNFFQLKEKFEKFKEYFYTINEDKNELISPHAFPFILKDNCKFTRDQLVTYLNENGIDTRDLFSSIPTQTPGYKFLGYKEGDFPVAEYIGNNGLHIGIHQEITEEDIEYIAETIKNFLEIYG